jgi:hypothetical protein
MNAAVTVLVQPSQPPQQTTLGMLILIIELG